MKLLLVISHSLNINLPDFTLLYFSLYVLLLGTLLLTLSLLVLLIAFVVHHFFLGSSPCPNVLCILEERY